MYNQPTTVRDYLLLLPAPYCTQALNNMDSEKANDDVKGMEHAIYWGFKWHLSAEGFTYWAILHAAVKTMLANGSQMKASTLRHLMRSIESDIPQ